MDSVRLLSFADGRRVRHVDFPKIESTFITIVGRSGRIDGMRLPRIWLLLGQHGPVDVLTSFVMGQVSAL